MNSPACENSLEKKYSYKKSNPTQVLFYPQKMSLPSRLDLLKKQQMTDGNNIGKLQRLDLPTKNIALRYVFQCYDARFGMTTLLKC